MRKFSDVPVVWVDDWEQLTPRVLEEQWARRRARPHSNAEQRAGVYSDRLGTYYYEPRHWKYGRLATDFRVSS